MCTGMRETLGILAACERLAYEAADAGLLSPDLRLAYGVNGFCETLDNSAA